MKLISALAVGLWGAFAAVAAAGEKMSAGPVVVELFTSQGCNACPPADAVLKRLATRADVLPLALHVDYWDYIGWKDKFAHPAFTARQKGYAHAAGRQMIYTPQMIVMGQDDVMGADAMEVADTIGQFLQRPAVMMLEASRSGTSLKVRMEPLAEMPQGDFMVQLVRYTPAKTVRITRGELAGRTMEYANVVEDWQLLQTWDGTGALQLTVDLPGEARAAVLVQEAPYGAVLAATRAD